jgi:hypothetical protein
MSESFTCAQCGGVFTSERSDEEAHAEAVNNWGADGRAPGMVVVCDDCYRDVMVRRQMAARLDEWCQAEADRMVVELLNGIGTSAPSGFLKG